MANQAKDLKKKLMTTWPKGRELRQIIGPKPAEGVFDLILASGYVSPQLNTGRRDDDLLQNLIDLFLDLEIENLNRTMRTIHHAAGYKLTRGTFGPIVNANTMPEVSYGVVVGESNAKKAARWVCNASNTTRGNVAEITIIERIIETAVQKTTAVNMLQGVDSINKVLLLGGGRHQARGPVVLPMRSPLPSSVGGRVMLESAMRFIEGRTPGTANCQWVDLGCYLLGAAIGCHGFPDANGRTGRVLYAICQVRGGGGFRGLTTAGEELVHGLPHQ